MESELIKSVRVRPVKEPSGYKTGAFEGGLLDYNVSIFRSGKRERFCTAYKLKSNGENDSAAWFPLTYSGRRYDDISDEELLKDYIRTNTIRENPTMKDGLVDIIVPTINSQQFTTTKVPFYQIIQDPFSKTPPPSRKFGSDPYHLNNGAQLFVRWFASEPKDVFFEFKNITTATQSSAGEVSIQIITNQPDRQPLVFTYSASNNPLQPGVTPSYNSVENYWESITEPGFSQLLSLSSNGLNYLLPGDKFVDPNSLQLVSGVQYGRESDNPNTSQGFGHIDGFIDDARDSMTQSISIKPKGLVKKIEVVPPDGQPIWILSDKTNDYISEFHPIYLTDIQGSTQSGTQSTSPGIKEKYFFDNSYDGDFSKSQDWMIISDLIEAWNKKIPGYNLELCNPSYISNKKIEYKDPIKSLDEIVAEESLQEPGPNTATESNLIKLNILFPTEFEVEARKDCPDFKIFVGDVPTELLPGEGFQFQDDFDDLEGLDPEYLEAAFAGGEELQNEFELQEIEEQLNNTNTTNTEQPASEIPSTGGAAGIAAKTPGFEGSIGNEFNGFPYFAQWDSRWGKKVYGSKCDGSPTIKSSGCGPTSVTMAICYWASKGYCSPAIPPEIAEMFERTGGRVCGVGTGLGPAKLAKELKDKYGLVLKAVKESQIRGILQKKYPCIISGKAYGSKGNAYSVSGKKTQNTTPGHFVCLTGIDGQGRIRVNDPGYAAKSGVAAFEANTNPSANMKSINQIYTLYPEKLGSPV